VEVQMRYVLKTGLASLAALAAATASAQAGDSYPIYSGAGFNAAVDVELPRDPFAPFGRAPWPQSLAPVGTLANPMPVRGPVTLFRLRTGEYRVIPRD
jgi:hypothetical protein